MSDPSKDSFGRRINPFAPAPAPQPFAARKAKAWPIRGVRVEGDKVIISVIGGNDAARWLCGAILEAHKP